MSDSATTWSGFMGNLVQQLVALGGARHVIVADTRPDALERAAAMGATRTIDVTRESVGGVVGDITESGANVSFEVTGAQSARRT